MREEVRMIIERAISAAMENGKDIRMEWRDYKDTRKTMGALMDSESCDNGFVINIYEPTTEE